MICYGKRPVVNMAHKEKKCSAVLSTFSRESVNYREFSPTNSTIMNKRQRTLAILSLFVAPSLAFFIFGRLENNGRNDLVVLKPALAPVVYIRNHNQVKYTQLSS